MTCPTCGTVNDSGRKFCMECGARLAATCPSCGAPNAPAAKFCGECGTSLAVAAPSQALDAGNLPAGQGAAGAAPDAPGSGGERSSERRLVSVLFADLVGFTALADGRDPEDTRELLSSYFDLAREVIARYGGSVEKFIGDAVMAVWGAPVAREDDAERCVRAGLELVAAVQGLRPGLQARAGAVTGEAAVTLGAVGQGMVAGDLVNTASRLQSVSPPGSVLVGEATHRAASRAIAFEPAGEQLLRGKVAPVPAFRALRVVAEVGGRNRSEVMEAPFVGRDEELRLLKDLFHATGRDGRARLVSVVGPAGIGKSRLAWEFLKYVDGLVETMYWHAGRSPAYGEGITFWALGEMVRCRCDLLATDDDGTTRRKVAEELERWVPDQVDRRWMETALLALLGTGEPPPGGRDELFAAWRMFFERIAAHGTVTMVFEDLQWADAGLLDFIDHLLEWSSRLPIYVVALARPELLERRPDFGTGKRNFTSLALEPLPERAMHQLLAGLVPGLPDPVARAIVARAEGVPLYAVETVRMLVADGKLAEADGAFRPVGDLSTLAVPETLTALIAARLDALDAIDRGLLQDAAVLGQSFTIAALAAVSGTDAELLEPRLRSLARRELLTVDADPRSPDRGQYGFVQALIREVAYNTLARADRKARHIAAARWFEALGDDELVGALAGQYSAACRNASPGPEADALAGQARIALRAAADRASALGSPEQALGFLRQALEVATDPAERAALWERAADAALNAADFGTVREYLDQAISWYRGRGERVALARAVTMLAQALQSSWQIAPAARLLEDTMAEMTGLETEPDVIRLMTELSRAYGNSDDPRAIATADRALAAAEARELVPVITEALLNRALALSMAGRLYEPMAILRGVLPLAEAHGLARSQVRALNNLSSALTGEDYRAAWALCRSGVELARRLGDRGWLFQFEWSVASFDLYLGEWADASRILSNVDMSLLAPPYALALSNTLACLQALQGDAEGADASLLAADPIRQAVEDPRVRATDRNLGAMVRLTLGRLEEAYDLAMAGVALGGDSAVWNALWAGRAALLLRDRRRADAAWSVLEARPERGRVIAAGRREIQAGVDALAGRTDAALAGYRDAVRRWRELDIPLELGLCLIEVATLLDTTEAEARAAADEARSLFTGLGSPTLLALLGDGLASRDAAAHPGRGAGARGSSGRRIASRLTG
jgi:class 3 adenylate cyclase/tetratricopeptide (TPR) repeat protein